MAGSPRGNVYAFEKALVWRVGANGIAVGQLDPDALTPSTTSHAYVINGTITASLPDVKFGAAEFRGGGTYEGRADMGLESVGEGTLTVSQMDADLDALLQGGLVDTTSLGGAVISAPNSLNPSARQVGLMLIARHQGRETANAGKNKYLHIIYPLVQMRMITPNLTQEGGTNPSPVTLKFQPSVAAYFPTGVAFGANQGWHQNSEFHLRLVADNPYALTTFVQDGADTTYVTGYRPVSNAVAGGNTTNWFTVNGAPTAPTSIDTTTGVVTLAAAGTSGQVAVAMYQTQFVAI